MAKLAGFNSWAAAHGLPAAKSRQCLANRARRRPAGRDDQGRDDQHPDFKGTPTFLINGAMLQNAFSWDALEPQLKAALGG